MDARCDQCDFYKALFKDARSGFCQRYPPVLVVVHREEDEDEGMRSRWPETASDEWCGEYKVKPSVQGR